MEVSHALNHISGCCRFLAPRQLGNIFPVRRRRSFSEIIIMIVGFMNGITWLSLWPFTIAQLWQQLTKLSIFRIIDHPSSLG
jgi:hypothetical protein